MAAVYSHPPNRRTLMCGPLTAKVSLRCMASKIEARVFSSAHAPVSPAGPIVRGSIPAVRTPDRRISGVASVRPWAPKKFSWR